MCYLQHRLSSDNDPYDIHQCHTTNDTEQLRKQSDQTVSQEFQSMSTINLDLLS